MLNGLCISLLAAECVSWLQVLPWRWPQITEQHSGVCLTHSHVKETSLCCDSINRPLALASYSSFHNMQLLDGSETAFLSRIAASSITVMMSMHLCAHLVSYLFTKRHPLCLSRRPEYKPFSSTQGLEKRVVSSVPTYLHSRVVGSASEERRTRCSFHSPTCCLSVQQKDPGTTPVYCSP